MPYTIKIPNKLNLGKPKSKEAVKLLKEYFASPVPLQKLPSSEESYKLSIVLPLTIEGEVQQLKAQHPDMSIPALVQNILWTMHAVKTGKPYAKGQKETSEEQNEKGSYTFRPEQERYYSQIIQAFDSAPDGIVLAEGSTGLGKGRVIAEVANTVPGDNEGVVVTAPTLQVLGQLMQEWQASQKKGRPVHFILGKSQFVSVPTVKEWLHDDAEDTDKIKYAKQKVQEWISSGGGRTTNNTKVFHDICPELAWLAEDLEGVSPYVPVEMLLLTKDRENLGCPGTQMYRHLLSQSVESEKNEVIYATHAALVWDQILRNLGTSALLPNVKHLIIDEAHLLSGMAEAAHSSSVALRSLLFNLKNESHWRHLRKLSKARTAAQKTSKAIDHIRKIGAQKKYADMYFSEDEDRKAIVQILDDVQKSIDELYNGNPTVNSAIETINAFKSSNYNATIAFSPVRKYPSITTGPKSLGTFFGSLWKRWESVLLTSATLLIPQKFNKPSASMIQVPMHIPKKRITVLPPVTTKWVFNATLHLVQENQTSLFPPQEGDYKDKPEDYEKHQEVWYNAVSNTLQHVFKTAIGGVLVLLPSYENIFNLGSLLEKEIGDRLIVQAPGNYKVARAKFVDLYSQGKHGLWLATGPAWQGLDLNDNTLPPEKDFMLTDLVIPRIPFGLERSSIHQERQKWFTPGERNRAAFQVKQGVGRLIRREGVLNRRIWFLDARIHDKKKAWLMMPIKGILHPYKVEKL